MLRLFFALLATLPAITYCAKAADECSDVLVHPLFDVKAYQRDSYVSTAILANLNQKADSATTNSLDLGVTVSGIPFSLGYADSSRMKSSLSEHYDFNSVEKESVSLLLMSGQQAIIDAWRDCMTKKSVVGVRFEPLDGIKGKNTFMHIEYFAQLSPGTATPPDLKLASDVYYDSDDLQIVSGSECLKAGYALKPGGSCTVQLVMKSAWTVLPLVLNLKSDTNSFGRYAYLAPRAQMKGKIKNWSDKVGVYAFDNSKWSEFKCTNADDGYVYLESSIKETATPGGMALGYPGHCKIEHQLDSTGRRMCVRAGIIGVPGTGDWYCTGDISATQATVYWDPPPPP